MADKEEGAAVSKQQETRCEQWYRDTGKKLKYYVRILGAPSMTF